MKQALIIIDIQNEYTQQGNLTIDNCEQVIFEINKLDVTRYDLVVSIRHINDSGLFSSPEATKYPENFNLNYDYEVIKQYADSFQSTNLKSILDAHSITDLQICGFMTQNCVTYTALTALNLDYKVTILSKLCSTIDQTVNNIALKALSSKVTIL